MVCLGAASLVVFLYQAAGSLMGGVMLLFLAVTAMHFLSGGFLPLVFLPTTFRAAAPFLPTYVLMEGMKLVVTSSFSLAVFIKLAVLAHGRVSAQRGSGGGQGMKRVAMWFFLSCKRYMRKWSFLFILCLFPPGAGQPGQAQKKGSQDISIAISVEESGENSWVMPWRTAL